MLSSVLFLAASMTGTSHHQSRRMHFSRRCILYSAKLVQLHQEDVSSHLIQQVLISYFSNLNRV